MMRTVQRKLREYTSRISTKSKLRPEIFPSSNVKSKEEDRAP